MSECKKCDVKMCLNRATKNNRCYCHIKKCPFCKKWFNTEDETDVKYAKMIYDGLEIIDEDDNASPYILHVISCKK